MSAKDTGGPAFPDPGRAQSVKQREILGNEGMTLRDYFAAKALPMAIEHWNNFHRNTDDGDGTGNEFTKENISLMVSDAYALADAMLREREK